MLSISPQWKHFTATDDYVNGRYFIKQLFSTTRVLKLDGGIPVEKQVYRVLVVDDWEPWRRFVTSAIEEEPGFMTVGEAADGLAAVTKAEELEPDLILLDIGLPKLNGLEVARRIRRQSPGSKILFCSENFSADIVEEALATGAEGFVLKSDAASDLLPAVASILSGARFVSRRFAGHDFADSPKQAISS